MTPDSIVYARGLTKRYGDFVAVNGIDFDVPRGQCVGILGPNGAGKSTTMRMIYCASPIDSGLLVVDGLDVSKSARQVKARIGVVPQESNLDGDLMVRQNLLVYARYFNIARDEARKRADDALELFQLTEKADAKVDSLSGGMKRRLVIARALINAPKVIILDEPSTGLDPQARQLVWSKLRQLKAQGATMILTTHYMEEATQLCDLIYVMNEGKILTSGAPTELIRRHVGTEVLEIHVPIGETAPVVDHVRTWGHEIETTDSTVYIFGRNGALPTYTLPAEQVIRRPASLEDVFLRLAGRSLAE